MLVIYLKMAFRADLSDAGGPDAPNWLKHLPLRAGEITTTPQGTASRILVRDTWNTDIVDELRPDASDIVLYKHRYSGFYQTDLDTVLKSRDNHQPGFCRMDHERVCRIHRPRRDVSRLSLPRSRGLHRRAHRQWSAAQQS